MDGIPMVPSPPAGGEEISSVTFQTVMSNVLEKGARNGV